jgi:hypothetical protein
LTANSIASIRRKYRVTELKIDERVDDDRRMAARAANGTFQIVDRLGARMAHLLELLFRKLCFERLHEACCRLAGGVGDDVQLDRWMLRHGGIVADNVPGHGRCDRRVG